MKILFLSFYYPPDLSAGSFRSSALVKALISELPSDGEIDVVTTFPNRYNSFTSEARKFDKQKSLTIYRVNLPKHKSGMIDQSKAFLAFARGVLRFLDGKDYDMVYATTSRLFTGALGAYVSRKLKKPFYLDVRDIFVDTIKDILPIIVVWFLLPILIIIERYVIRSASKVNLVSAGFLPYFKKSYVNQKFQVYTNGIDKQFLTAQPAGCTKSYSKILTVVYAGNIGEGQGLHKIIPKLALNLRERIKFKVIGDGGLREKFEDSIIGSECNNIELLLPVRRNELIEIYQAADILFLHLNDYEAFRKVLPSKLFEYATMGKPIWAGVSGFASQFISNNIENAAVFSPCDVSEATASFEKLKIMTVPRKDFVEKFERKKIMKKMGKDIINLMLDN